MTTAYQRVSDSVRDSINAGIWKPGDQLPTEMELMRQHGVSRNTVRQALAHLEMSNLVRRHQGRGTFVGEQGVSHLLGDLRSFTETLRDLNKVPGISDLHITVDDAPPEEAKKFLPGTHLWVVERVRTADGRPFSRMQSWLPDAIASALDPEQFAENQSLYAQMEAILGIKPAEGTEIIRSEKATAEDAAALDVARGTPLLSTYRWTSDHRGQPIEYVRSVAPGDRYEYVIKLRQ